MSYGEEVCGNCKFSQYDYDGSGMRNSGGYYCCNERSINCGVPTLYDDTCDDFEDKEDWS